MMPTFTEPQAHPFHNQRKSMGGNKGGRLDEAIQKSHRNEALRVPSHRFPKEFYQEWVQVQPDSDHSTTCTNALHTSDALRLVFS